MRLCLISAKAKAREAVIALANRPGAIRLQVAQDEPWLGILGLVALFVMAMVALPLILFLIWVGLSTAFAYSVFYLGLWSTYKPGLALAAMACAFALSMLLVLSDLFLYSMALFLVCLPAIRLYFYLEENMVVYEPVIPIVIGLAVLIGGVFPLEGTLYLLLEVDPLDWFELGQWLPHVEGALLFVDRYLFAGAAIAGVGMGVYEQLAG